MDALISGAAGKAVLLNGRTVTYLDVPTGEDWSVSYSSAQRLLPDAYDVELLKDVSRERALSVATRKWSVDRAIRMFQIVLDREAKRELRQDAAEALEALLDDESVFVGATNLTFSLPFPDQSDHEFAHSNLSGKAFQFYELLNTHQEEIAEIRLRWNGLSSELFDGSAERYQFEIGAALTGCYRLLSIALKDRKQIQFALLEAYRSARHLPNSREVITAWTRDLSKRVIRRQIEQEERESDFDYLEGVSGYDKNSRSAHAEYQSVNREKEGIIEQLRRGDEARAREFTEQLIQRQLRSKSAEFAVKSLCSLAQEARIENSVDLQLEWLDWATRLLPSDAWAHAQAGDAFLSLMRFTDATREYELAERLGAERYGATGRARVLTATGNLDEALGICNDLIGRLPSTEPEMHRTWAAKSEILREQSRLEDALASYTDAIERFPNQPVLQCGRAAVLADLARFPEAYEAYSDAIRCFPEEPVPYCGRAEVLRMMGSLDQALIEYRGAGGLFLNEVVPKAGAIAVQIDLGLFDEAITDSREAMSKHPFEPVFVSLLSEALREAGQPREALDLLRAASESFQRDVRIRNALANAYKHVGDFQMALQIHEQNTRDFPYNLGSLFGRASLLKLLASYDDALAAYEEIITKRPDNVQARNAIASIYVIKGMFKEAHDLIPNDFPRIRSDWVSLHIHGMISLKRGRLNEARDIFEFGQRFSPYFRGKSYFSNGLAAVLLRLGDYRAASQVPHDIEDPIGTLLKAHSLIGLGTLTDAKPLLDSINDNNLPSVVRLRDQLAHGLVSNGRRIHSMIIDQEIEVLLQAA